MKTKKEDAEREARIAEYRRWVGEREDKLFKEDVRLRHEFAEAKRAESVKKAA